VPLVAESEISERKYSSERSPEEIKKDSVRDIKNGGTTQKTTQKSSQNVAELIKQISEMTRNELVNILSDRVGSRLAEKVGRKLVENQLKILILVGEKPEISKRELAEILGISTTAIDKNIIKLKSLGVIRRVGPDRGGYWEVVE
jgi:ATP-dependent DNA helicase RecG